MRNALILIIAMTGLAAIPTLAEDAAPETPTPAPAPAPEAPPAPKEYPLETHPANEEGFDDVQVSTRLSADQRQTIYSMIDTGNQQFANKNYFAAVHAYKQAEKVDSGNLTLLKPVGRACVEAEFFPQAVAALEPFRAANPADALTNATLVRAYEAILSGVMFENDFEQAQILIGKILDIKADHAHAALVDENRALTVSAKIDSLRSSSAELRKKRRNPVAMKRLERLVALAPKDYPALVMLAATYSDLRLYDKAEETYRTAMTIKTVPEDRGRLDAYLWGQARYNKDLKEYNVALASLEKLRAAHPDDVNVLVETARAMLGADGGQSPRAVKTVQRAKELAPKSAKVALAVAEIRMEGDQVQDALSSLAEAAKDSDDPGLILKTLGDYHAKLADAAIADRTALMKANNENAAADKTAAEKATAAQNAVAALAAKQKVLEEVMAAKAAAEQAVAAKVAEIQALAEKLAQAQAAVEAANAAKVEADKVATEKAVVEKTGLERMAAVQAAMEKVKADRAAADQAMAEKVAVNKAMMETVTAAHASTVAERTAAEKAAADLAAALGAPEQTLVAKQEEADAMEKARLKAEQLVAAKAAEVKTASDGMAVAQAEAERLTAQKAEMDKAVDERMATAQKAKEAAAAAKAAADKALAEKAAAKQTVAERVAAALAAMEKVKADKAAADKLAAEKVAATEAAKEKMKVAQAAAQQDPSAQEVPAAEEAADPAPPAEEDPVTVSVKAVDAAIVAQESAAKAAADLAAASKAAEETLAAAQAEAASMEAARVAAEQAVAAKTTELNAAIEGMAAAQTAAEQLAAQKAEMDKAMAEKLAAAKQGAEAAAAAKAAADQVMAEKAAATQALAQAVEAARAALERVKADKAAADQVVVAKVAAAQAAKEKMDASQATATAEQTAAEKAAADLVAALKTAEETFAAVQAEATAMTTAKQEMEQIVVARVADVKAATDGMNSTQAASDQLTAQMAEMDKAMAEAVAAAKKGEEEAAAAKAASEKMAAEKAVADQALAQKVAAVTAAKNNSAAAKKVEARAVVQQAAAERAAAATAALEKANEDKGAATGAVEEKQIVLAKATEAVTAAQAAVTAMLAEKAAAEKMLAEGATSEANAAEKMNAAKAAVDKSNAESEAAKALATTKTTAAEAAAQALASMTAARDQAAAEKTAADKSLETIAATIQTAMEKVAKLEAEAAKAAEGSGSKEEEGSGTKGEEAEPDLFALAKTELEKAQAARPTAEAAVNEKVVTLQKATEAATAADAALKVAGEERDKAGAARKEKDSLAKSAAAAVVAMESMKAEAAASKMNTTEMVAERTSAVATAKEKMAAAQAALDQANGELDGAQKNMVATEDAVNTAAALSTEAAAALEQANLVLAALQQSATPEAIAARAEQSPAESYAAFKASGLAYIGAKQWNPAIRSFGEGLKRNGSGDTEFFHNYGMAYFNIPKRNMGALNASIKHLSKAAELDENHLASYSLLGDVYMSRNNPPWTRKAIASLEKAGSLSAEDANTFIRLGNAYGREQRYVKAYAAYERAIKLEPARPAHLVRYTETQLEEGRYLEALEKIGAAGDVGKSIPAQIVLAKALNGLERWEDARNTCNALKEKTENKDLLKRINQPLGVANRGLATLYRSDREKLVVVFLGDGTDSEKTWRDPERKAIPNLWGNLKSKGLYREGVSLEGHFLPHDLATAATTGQWLLDDKTPLTYHQHIRPQLMAQCGRCHNEEKDKGKFVVDDYEKMMKGGEEEGEKVVIPKKGDESYLVKCIISKDMPPKEPVKGTGLTGLLKQWIDQGASVGEPTASWTLPHPTFLERFRAAHSAPPEKVWAVVGNTSFAPLQASSAESFGQASGPAFVNVMDLQGALDKVQTALADADKQNFEGPKIKAMLDALTAEQLGVALPNPAATALVTELVKRSRYMRTADDQLTYTLTQEIIEKHKPDVLFVAFKNPSADSDATDVRRADAAVYGIWEKLQSHKEYRNNTNFIVVTPFPGENSAAMLSIGPRVTAGAIDRGEKLVWNRPYLLTDLMVVIANHLGIDYEVPESYLKAS